MEHRKHSLQNKQGPDAARTIERRFVTEKVEHRASESSDMGEVFGYALKWGVEYDMGWYTEIISRGALDNADMSDIRVLDNHENHLVLGRTKSGTADFGLDDIGAWYRSSLPNSPNGQNMRESLIRGDIDQSSWGFMLRTDSEGKITGDRWEMRDGRRYRIITDVAVVFDASPVTFPANPDTSAAKRSAAMANVVRDDSEMISTPEDGPEEMVIIDAPSNNEPSSTWSIGWMADTVASAIKGGNSMVRDLNYLISEYEYYSKAEIAEAPIFKNILDKCLQSKAAAIEMMNAHLDAMRELNSAENRSATDTWEDKNTIDVAELEQFERRRQQLLQN